MTTTQTGPATVRLRTPRRDWLPLLLAGVLWLALAAWSGIFLEPVGPVAGLPVFQLVLGGLLTAEAALLSTFGVDLTPEAAIVRSFRRQTIAWSDLQGVVSTQRFGGAWVIQFVPAQGRPITLRAGTSWFGFGVATHVRQFHQVGQWWLAHRGPDWRPAS